MKPIKRYLPKVLVPLVVCLLVVGLVTILYPQSVGPEPGNQLKDNLDQTPPLTDQPLSDEVHCGDGSMTLIRKIEFQSGQPQTYSFRVASLTGQDRNERQIFSMTAEAGKELSIHLNSWSPDNKYVFLQEKDQAGNLNYLVFKASGEPFANNELFLDVGAFFKQKLPKYSLREATGWASPIFVNIATNEGPAYWFDVQSLAFWGHR